VRDNFERFDFDTQVERLAKTGLLYQVAERFAQIDLHPESVDNHQLGLVFEETRNAMTAPAHSSRRT
jgi:type I restriction enzyme M protein